MKVLITVASRHGSTAEIAWAIRGHLIDEGIEAALVAPEEITALDGYDAAVIGSALYGGGWLPAARELVERLRTQLGDVPVWLFSSGGPASGSAEPDDDTVDVSGVVDASGARGHEIFAGRIDMAALDVTERALVRALRVPTGDFRDWPAIAAWSRNIAAQLRSVSASPPAR